ncbi:MAG: hypothetical protein ACI90V_003167 [Bacillariaceae sp.]|jgi:hypothetical protein
MIDRRLLVAYLAATIICIVSTTTAFVVVNPCCPHRQYATTTNSYLESSSTATKAATNDAETSSAAALTDFMAKAHEEKIAAMARVETKYRDQIDELENKITELEAAAKQTTPTSGNSFAFPATNKDLTSKVQAYRSFISDYIVKAQAEKQTAIKAAENKMSAKYEAIIDGLKGK